MTTTVRTSCNRAYQKWLVARRAVEQAGMTLASQHTKENKLALRRAQEAEQKALKNYADSRLAKYAAVLNKQVKQ